MIDGGVENTNKAVTELCDNGLLKTILAQTEIMFSNSMIEAFWRTLKHQWLYINSLDNMTTLKRLVAYYIDEYNGVLPHQALNGLTPDEVYFGVGGNVCTMRNECRAEARRIRFETNRNMD